MSTTSPLKTITYPLIEIKMVKTDPKRVPIPIFFLLVPLGTIGQLFMNFFSHFTIPLIKKYFVNVIIARRKSYNRNLFLNKSNHYIKKQRINLSSQVRQYIAGGEGGGGGLKSSSKCLISIVGGFQVVKVYMIL